MRVRGTDSGRWPNGEVAWWEVIGEWTHPDGREFYVFETVGGKPWCGAKGEFAPMDEVAPLRERVTTGVDQRQDEQIRDLERAVLWLLRGSVGLLVGLGVLGWWVLLRVCG